MYILPKNHDQLTLDAISPCETSHSFKVVFTPEHFSKAIEQCTPLFQTQTQLGLPNV
jgi:hypothetical protein